MNASAPCAGTADMKRNIIRYVTWQYLKKNPRRTIISVVTMALAVVLLTCVFTGRDTAVSLLTRISESEYGSWHIACYDITQEQFEELAAMDCMEDAAVTENMMLSGFSGSADVLRPFINIRRFSEKAFRLDNITVTEGRLPENSSEIVLSEAVRADGSAVTIGDTVDAECFRRYISYFGEGETIFPYQSLFIKSGERKEVGPDFPCYTEETGFYDTHEDIHEPTGFKASYTVTGFIRVPSFETEYGAYTAITYIEPAEASGVFNSLFTVDPAKYDDADRREIAAVTDGSFEVNSPVLAFTGDSSSGAMNFIITGMQVFFVFLIMFVSLILIRSLFDLAYDSRRKYLGILTSIGATSRQKRSSVYFEALVFAAAGLLIGIPLGFLVTKAGILLLEPSLLRLMQAHPASAVSAPLVIRPLSLALTVLFTLITALLSAMKPARTVAKTGPIESIRGNDSINGKMRPADLSRNAVQTLSSALLRNDRKSSRGIVSSAAVYIVLVVTVTFAASEVIKMSSVKLGGNQSWQFTDHDYDTVHDTADVRSYIFSEMPEEFSVTGSVRKDLAGTDGITDIRTYGYATLAGWMDNSLLAPEYFDAEYAVLSRFYPEGLDREDYEETYVKDHEAVINIATIENDRYASLLDRLHVTGNEKGCLILNEGAMSTDNWRMEDRQASDYLYMEIPRMTSLQENDAFSLKFADIETGGLLDYPLKVDGFVTNKDLQDILEVHDYNLWIILPQSLSETIAGEVPAYRHYLTMNTYFRAENTSSEASAMVDRLYDMNSDSVRFAQVAETSEESARSAIASMIRILMACFALIASVVCCLSLYNAISGLMNARRTAAAMLKSAGAEDRQIYAVFRRELTCLLLKAGAIGVCLSAVLCFGIRKVISARFGSYAVSFPILPLAAVILLSLTVIYALEYRAVRKITGSVIENIRGLA